ncbi:RNA polymerase sigma factor [Candidatus Zixiibacteriota bacterium]
MLSPQGDLKKGEIAGREAVLVQRALEGDLPAFEELYRLEVGRVYAICLRLTADAERAEVLTQDTFVQVWKTLHSFRGDSAFSTWLHRLAVNTVLQEQRARKRRREKEELSGDISSPDHAQRPPQEEIRIDLERAIAALPERARLVFVLHEIEGYRHEEIAKMMNTSTGTSKAQLHRARGLLRKNLRR